MLNSKPPNKSAKSGVSHGKKHTKSTHDRILKAPLKAHLQILLFKKFVKTFDFQVSSKSTFTSRSTVSLSQQFSTDIKSSSIKKLRSNADLKVAILFSKNQTSHTLLKFKIPHLWEVYRNPRGEDRLPTIHFSRGELLNFRRVIPWNHIPYVQDKNATTQAFPTLWGCRIPKQLGNEHLLQLHDLTTRIKPSKHERCRGTLFLMDTVDTEVLHGIWNDRRFL